MVENSYIFRFGDFVPIVERGSLRILELYMAQHDYQNYRIDFKKIKITDTKIIERIKNVKDVGRGAVYAIKANNAELFKFYAENFDIHLSTVVYNAFKYNRFIHVFTELTHYLEYFKIRGQCRNGFFDVINVQGERYLIKAIKSGNAQYYNKFIEQYGDDTENNKRILTDVACATGLIDLAKKMKDKNQCISFALRHACRYNQIELLRCFKVYLPKDMLDCAVMFECAGAGGSVEVIKFLINHYEDTSFVNKCCMFACEYGRLDAVKYLFENYLDKIEDHKQDIFYRACELNHLDLVKFLLKYSKVDETAIKYSCNRKSYYVCAFFAEIGIRGCCYCAEEKCPLGRVTKKNLIN